MDGPWTQFAPQPPPSGAPDASPAQAGPWTLYAAQKPVGPDLSTVTEFGPSYSAPAPAEPAPGNAAAERIESAAANAFRGTPEVLTPAARDALNRYGGTGPTGVGEFANRVAHGATNIIGGAHAGIAALSQAAMEVFGEKGGRDALALLSALPMAPETAQAMSLLKTARPDTAPAASPAAAAPPNPRYISELTMPPDTVGLTPLHRIQDLIRHDDMENGPAAPDRGMANQSIAAIGNAPDIDSAIAAAGKAAQAPYVPVTASQVSARDGVDINEAYRRATAENLAERSPEITAADAPTPNAPAVVAGQQAAGVPNSVGAAASRDNTLLSQIDISTADMKANRRRAEMDELLAPAELGDKRIHVEGSLPTLAEYTGDPETAQVENMLRQRNAGAFVGEGKPLTVNNAARVAKVDAQTVPDPTLNTMRKDRNDQWIAASNDILPSAKPADLTPAWDWVSGELDNPRIQENDAVRGVLEDFRNRLIDDDGNLKTDAAAVWGMHDHLQNLLNKAKDPLSQTSAEKFAESQILKAKEMVDQAMNVATDNKFQTALDNYAEASKPINSGVLMNTFRPKLTNMAGDIQAANFHRFMLGLAKERGDPGIDPSMDISDVTMRALMDVDKDLKRAGLIKVGAAAGSPTNLLGALAESAGVNAAHSVMGSIPGVGPLIKAGTSALAKLRLDKLTEKHLAPPEGDYAYPRADNP